MVELQKPDQSRRNLKLRFTDLPRKPPRAPLSARSAASGGRAVTCDRLIFRSSTLPFNPSAATLGPVSIPTQDAPLPTGDEKAAAVRAMFDAIAPRYDLVNRLMTFGLDVVWRKQTMKALRLRPQSIVADLACGT